VTLEEKYLAIAIPEMLVPVIFVVVVVLAVWFYAVVSFVIDVFVTG